MNLDFRHHAVEWRTAIAPNSQFFWSNSRRFHVLNTKASASGILVAAMLWGAGCAIPADPKNPVVFALTEVYEANGKLTVTSGERNSSMRFRWRYGHAGLERQQFDLWEARGRGREHTRIYFGDGRLRVLSPDRKQKKGSEAQQFVDSMLGPGFRMEELSYWLRFAPDWSDIAYDAVRQKHNKLIAFRQSGWLIELLETDPRYHDRFPSLLSISRDGTRLLVEIECWEVSAICRRIELTH